MSATPQLPPVAKLEQKTVVDLIAKGNRIDERGHDSYRPITIQTGVIEKANGSAQIFLGKTRVLVGIKVETGEPFPDTPEEGVLTVNAELVPLAQPSLEEEQVMNARLTVTIEKSGSICAMQKGGLSGFTTEELRKIVHIAVERAAENRAKILAAAKI